jgi:DNA polymerase I-like protein with 3'-5' exonuclease and polymerase domains
MIITIDFETYFARDFSLTKLSTEEYVRDDRFEVIGVGVKVDEEDTEWFSGSFQETSAWLQQFDWANAFVLAHNTMFDGAILSWRFGIKPAAWMDTLSMARAIDNEASNSLAKLAARYDIGVKGDDTKWAIGLRRSDFSPEQLRQYGAYCCNDVELTYRLFTLMRDGFKKKELRLMDLTIRMFTEPTLELNLPLLEQHLMDVVERKEKLIEIANSDRETLLSNQKFAAKLIEYGVSPPMKISPTTGKWTLALAKNDEGLKNLELHPKEEVQALVAARLGTKSTLEETRTDRLISIAKRGSLPVPLRYYAAHTGRWGGDDKLNLQNLPRKSPLKQSICPPKGYVLIDSDSAQIEARILAWLAGQDDLVRAFENGEDVYKQMASNIYGVPIDRVSDEERFVGKTTILGCGYGMGAAKFRAQLETFGLYIPESFSKSILNTYRRQFGKIVQLWEQGDTCLHALVSQELKTTRFGTKEEAVYLLPGVGFDFPSGIPLRYRNLRQEIMPLPTFNGPSGHPMTRDGMGFTYDTRKGKVKIYGGKVIENVCQALARCVIGEQMLKISDRYRVVLTVHDAIACVAKEEEADEAAAYVQECMRWRPKWAQTLPLNCEVKIGSSYGDMKKWKGRDK